MIEVQSASPDNSPLTMTRDQLPGVLPVFPLPGALLLPRQQLPLNIFEPRYLNLVLDSLAAGRIFGMVQPDPAAEADEPPKVYRTGCAGRVTAFNETDDGRLLINLTGLCRFTIREELQIVRGYRRVAPDWQAFSHDLEEPAEETIDIDAMEPALMAYFKARELEVKWDALKCLPPASVVDFLSANLPLGTDEKQLLLEAGTAAERAVLLRSIVDFGAQGDCGAGPTRH